MSFTQIKKRNGQIAIFDRMRIYQAIVKASASAETEIPADEIDSLVDGVVAGLEDLFAGDVPDVESTQDLVEQALMRGGYFKTARSFIIYRDTHKMMREAAQAEKLEHAGISVTMADGSSAQYGYPTIIKTFVEAAHGIEGVDIEELAEYAKANVYDGMSEDEFDDALILAAKSSIEKDPAYDSLAARLLQKKMYKEVLGASEAAEVATAYKTIFKNFIESGIKNKLLHKQMTEFDLDKLADAIKPDRDNIIDYMGLQTLYSNYFLRPERESKIVLEVPQIFWMRVSMGMALNEDKKKRTAVAIEFYNILSTKRYTPSSPTLFNSGTSWPQMSSCYLNTVEDDLDHIFKVYRDNALMSKFSGGIGTDWSNIRSTGSLIKTINIPSQGVVPFLKIANDVTVAIARSGRRIGATCVYLENWHLDFEDFLELRKNTGDERRRTHDMNTASWVPDLFIKRVEANAQWTLFSPEEVPELHHIYGKEFEQKYEEYEKLADAGKIRQFRRVSALQLWRKMLTMLFETGHPWITFKDACNVRSPQDHVGVVHNSNLCTEITLNNSREETAVCNIGSVNLATHIKGGKLDRELLADTVKTAIRMLDNVIDITFYPTKENETANQRHRPVGIGIMGFQDALYMLDMEFESDKAIAFADESMEFVSYHAIMGSAELAREKGTYGSYKGSKWDRGIFPIDTLDMLEKERGEKIDVKRTSKLDWKPVRALVKKYGMRNSNTMAIAPTASISNINGCYPCIEPIYKNLYVKSNMNGEFTVINPYLVTDLKKLNLWGPEMVQKLKFHDGSVQKITEIPEDVRRKYKEVFEIDPMALIRVTAYRGKWLDQSQSFNVFVSGVSGKQLSDLYIYAWRMGLKTTYYLRSLAISQVEKSTVNAAEMGATHKREFAGAIADNAPKPESDQQAKLI